MTASASLSFENRPYNVKETIRNLTRVNFEGLFLDDIKKVIDELNIMSRMSQQHRNMLVRFQDHVEAILDPDGEWREGGVMDHDYRRTAITGETEEWRRRQQQFSWFRARAEDVISVIDGRIGELETLTKTAETTSRDVRMQQKRHFSTMLSFSRSTRFTT